MFTKDIVVRCESGLHNNQATYFVQKANEFACSISLEAQNRRMNAKSLLGVLSLGITKGLTITILAEGPDEEEAVNDLVALVSSDFA